MLTPEQAQQLRQAGLTAYNHNLDTSPEFYGQITTTRRYEDRLATLAAVRDAGEAEAPQSTCGREGTPVLGVRKGRWLWCGWMCLGAKGQAHVRGNQQQTSRVTGAGLELGKDMQQLPHQCQQ